MSILLKFEKSTWPKIISFIIISITYYIVRSEHIEAANTTVMSPWILLIGVVSFLIALFLLDYERWDFNWILCGLLLTIQLGVIYFWWRYTKIELVKQAKIKSYSNESLYIAIITIIIAIILTIIKLFTLKNIEDNSTRNNWRITIRYFILTRMKNIQDIITLNRPGYMFVALTLFLSTMFYISFSFAFHDIYSRKKSSNCSIIRSHIDPANGKLPEKAPGKPGRKNNFENYGVSIPKNQSLMNKIKLPAQMYSDKTKTTCLKNNTDKLSINFENGSAEILIDEDIIKSLMKAFNATPKKQNNSNYNSSENTKIFLDYDISTEHIEKLITIYGQAEIDKYYNGNKDNPREITTITLLNSYVFSFITSTIKQNKDRHHFIISLAGYASSEKIKNSKYPSNYELSESRAIRVRETISNLMFQYNVITENCCPSVDWIISPMTSDCKKSEEHMKCLKTVITIFKTTRHLNDKTRLDICDTVKKSNANLFLQYRDMQKHSEEYYIKNFSINSSFLHSEIQNSHKIIKAEFKIFKKTIENNYRNILAQYSDLQQKITNVQEPANNNDILDPKLLDYLHYTIYTITTTGYGDMSPADDYAKFLTSLTNIFEILFGLIFFNVILSRGNQP